MKMKTQQPKTCAAAAAAAKSLQSCPTLCDPTDGSPPGSPVPGILQARTLEWVAISFSNGWKWKGKVKLLSRVWLFATPWTAAYQAPPSMRFSRQEHWSRVPSPSLALKASGSQRGPATLTSSSSTLAQDLNQKIWEWSPVIRVLKSLAGDPDACLSLKTNDLDPCLTNYFYKGPCKNVLA